MPAVQRGHPTVAARRVSSAGAVMFSSPARPKSAGRDGLTRSASVDDMTALLINSPQKKLANDEEVWCYDNGSLLAGSGRWTKAEVVRNVSDTKVLVRLFKLDGDRWTPANAKEVEVYRRIIQPSNANRQDDTEDIAALSNLNEPAIMDHIRKRYVAAKARHEQGIVAHGIYTRAGNVIVAMNPFTPVESLYSDEQLNLYRNAASGSSDVHDLPPHIFEVAARAFRGVQKNQAQSIIINGDSGSGKTESTKKLFSYFARAAGGRGHGALVSEQLMRSNPVLEAFGNAKTIRNDNSSRFGKFVTLHFRAEDSSELAYGSVQQYLLEKTRVVSQGQGEQTYHAFYHLALGAPASLRKEVRLGDATKALGYFGYFHQPMDAASGPGRRESAGAEFSRTHAALVALAGGKKEGEATAHRFWRTVAGVLHLGQLQFDESASSGEARLIEDCRTSLVVAADLLEISDVPLLEYALTNRTIGGGKSPRTANEAVAARDTLAKAFYEGLFEELTEIVNLALKPPGAMLDSVSNARIGLLDIFGSEVFDKNHFEQLLINYANDKLQNYFKQTSVGKVRELYEREEIGLNHLPGAEPPPSLVLLEGPPPSLTSREKLDRLRIHFRLSARDDESVIIPTLEQYLGLRVPEGRSLEQRRDELFRSVFRTSLLQLLVDRGNYSDKATERENKDTNQPDENTGIRRRLSSAGGVAPRRFSVTDGATDGGLNQADKVVGENLANFCSKYPAYVTAGRFDNRPVGLSWRYAVDTDAGGEWLKMGNYDKWKASTAGFAIKHFGSVVFYEVEGFTEKNTDYVDGDLAQLVANSQSGLNSGVERKTVAGKFKTEMRKLVDETLAPTAGHFIRCIKPNHEQQRFKLDDAASVKLTLSQLNCCGVLEAAQITAAGFPNREDYLGFLNMFSFNGPAFRRHNRQRFPPAPNIKSTALQLEKRQINLCRRFPHASEDEVKKALEAHKGHAGRATRSLSLAAARLEPRESGLAAKKSKVRKMLVEVFGLVEELDFVMGKSLLFLKANVLARVQTHFARLQRCREQMGIHLKRHEIHYRIWWSMLAIAKDKARLTSLLRDNARDEASRKRAEIEAVIYRKETLEEAVMVAKIEVREEVQRERQKEKAAMAAQQEATLHALRAELEQQASAKLKAMLESQMKEGKGQLDTLRTQLQTEFEERLKVERHTAALDKKTAVDAVTAKINAFVRDAATKQKAAEKESQAQIASLRTAAEVAKADRTQVLAAQAEAKAALDQAEGEHQRALDQAVSELKAAHRKTLEDMDAQAAAELQAMRLKYDAALSRAKRDLAEAAEDAERYKADVNEQIAQARMAHTKELRAVQQESARELQQVKASAQAEQSAVQRESAEAVAAAERKIHLEEQKTKREFEARLKDELRLVKEEEKQKQEGSWMAQLALALNERAVNFRSPTKGEPNGVANGTPTPRSSMAEQVVPNGNGHSPRMTLKAAGNIVQATKRMSTLKRNEGAQIAEWERTAREAKAKEAMEVAEWIEKARAAKAKEAAKLEEWRQSAKLAQAKQSLI